MTSEPRSFAGRLSSPLRKIVPNLDHRVWESRRKKHCKARYRELSAIAASLPTGGINNRPTHLVIAAHHGPDASNWHLAGGNIGFETYTSAVEILGAENVTLFGVGKDEPEESWHARLLNVLVETRATHFFGQIEIDPNQAHNWSWDVIATVFAQHWDGIFLGLMHDSAFTWLQLKTKQLGKIYRDMVYIDICVPIDGYIVPGRPEVGPVTMPMSQASVAVIQDHVAGVSKKHQVSFIGALYDYRVDLIDSLRAEGFDVAVNPHRPDVTKDYLESRTNQPSYLDYMRGLAESELTINFSLASGGPHEQYKIRIQEASLVGTLCLTDDKDRTKRFFSENEYRYFESLQSMESVVQETLADPTKLRTDQSAARTRAEELATNDFWGSIDAVLTARGYSTLTGVSQPRK